MCFLIVFRNFAANYSEKAICDGKDTDTGDVG